MRLLFLNHNPEGLGTYFRVLFLARYLGKMGHTTTIICSARERFNLKISRRTVGEGVEVVTLPAIVLHRYLTGRTGRAVFASFWSLLGRWDLLHAFAVSQPETGLPAVAAHLTGRGPVVTDWDDDWGRGILANHPAPIRLMFDFMERHAVRVGEVTTVVSDYLRTRAIECGIDSAKVVLVPNGANVDDIRPLDRSACRTKLGIPEGISVIVAMGHTYYIEKMHRLLDAFRQVTRQVPQARLYLVGGLKPSKVAAYCGEVMDKIVMAGERPFAEVQYYLGASDVLALPMDGSIFETSRFPIRVGDYLASGRPIVSNAVGEPKRIIETEQCGLTCRPDDTAGFAEAICRVLGDPAEAAAMGRRGRTAAEERYSWQKIVRKLDAVYADLV